MSDKISITTAWNLAPVEERTRFLIILCRLHRRAVVKALETCFGKSEEGKTDNSGG